MDAMKLLLQKATGKYFVVIEEDMIWFQDDWLKNLVKAFEQSPNITKEGLEMGFKNEWGGLATRCLTDNVNNAGMWPEFFKGVIQYDINGIWYWANIHATGGAIIYKTELLQKLDAFNHKSKALNGILYRVLYLLEIYKYPTALLRDTYIYHACSPYWNKLYHKVFEEKQKGQTIEEAFKIYSEKGNFNWDNKEPMSALLNGTFGRYATKLWEDTCNRK